MSKQTESEFKLRAHDTIEVAAVDAALRELGAQCRRSASHRHVDTYLDDDRGSLWQAGIGLRIRESGGGRQLTCKLRGSSKHGLFVRTELESGWPEEQPPQTADALSAELRDVVQPFVLDRPLLPRQRLEVQRESRILTQAGKDLCELAIDTVEASSNGRAAAFQEIELEVIEDVAGNHQLAEGLRERLPLAFAKRDKPSHAAALLGIEHAQGSSGDSGGSDDEQPAGAAVQRRLQALLLVQRHAEIGVREDRQIEPVHQMRVATRRMRSLVRAFRELWPEQVSARLLAQLGETGRQLGAVRDLDVMLENLPDGVELLPPQLYSAGQQTIKWVRGQRNAALDQLHAWLRSDARLAGCRQFENDLPAVEHDCDHAREPVVRAAARHLAKAVAGLRMQISEIAPELPIEPAHRLRLAAKRVRYLGEEFANLRDFDLKKSLRAITRVQQAFGDLCDHETAAERLLGWVHAAAAASPDGAWTAAALGGLAANHTAAGLTSRIPAEKALRRADRKRVWRSFPVGSGKNVKLA